jgi:hypothetical protein
VVKQTVVCVSLIVLSCAFLTPTVSAQESSGIAGVVRDAQGAVMPWVTVETHDRIKKFEELRVFRVYVLRAAASSLEVARSLGRAPAPNSC